jgi:hypothetical protein
MESIDSLKAEIATLEQSLKDKKAELRALKPAGKAKAEPRECECGCGEMTNGGLFRPGHDAKLRSRLLKAIDAGDEDALAELIARPTLLHGATEADLRDRLGSETRKQDAQVARQVERDAAKAEKSKTVRPAPKPTAKPRVDPIEAQQGSRSDTVKRNGAAIKLAQQRA